MNNKALASVNNLDFVRLVAVSLVIVGHAYPLLGQPGIPLIFGTTISTYAVKIFFVLSGFLILASWERDPHTGRFLLKRVLRIFPALCVTVLLTALVIGPAVTRITIKDYFAHWMFFDYFKNMRLYFSTSLPGVFESNTYPNTVNGSLWSLPVEFSMYLLVLVLGMSTRFFAPSSLTHVWFAATLSIIAISVLDLYLKLDLLTDVVIYSMPMALAFEVVPYFMLGGCLWLARGWLPSYPKIALFLLTAGVLFGEKSQYGEPLFMLVSSYAIITLGSESTPILRNSAKMGDLSYGMYLYGFPVAQTISWAIGAKLPFTGHVVLTLVISAALAFASWHLVEKHALRFKPKLRAKAA